jgi:hypothetical protein
VLDFTIQCGNHFILSAQEVRSGQVVARDGVVGDKTAMASQILNKGF